MLCYHCMREKGDANYCPFCGASGMPETMLHQLQPGTVIGGRYTIGKVLGEGGFGITYIAKNVFLDKIVAIKEYFPHGYCSRNATGDATVLVTSGSLKEVFERGRSRFLKEAKTLEMFQNDSGIVDVIDFFEENNTAYIVMEYLDGVTLRDYLKEHGVFDCVEVIRMLMPMMQALEKVHAAGVIHRDISPDNIMLLKNGTLKLMDFGAARDYDGDNRSMSVMLKQGYAPEEQYRRNGKQGPWTDVYGLCATIYRCITGAVPVESLDRIRQDDLRAPSTFGIKITPSLEKALLYGMAVYKDDRCPDMGTLIALFERAMSGEDLAMLTMVADDAVTDPRPQKYDPNATMRAEETLPSLQQQGYPQQLYDQSPQTLRQSYVPSPPVQPVRQQQKKGSKGAVIAAICVILVLLITGGIITAVVLSNRNDDDSVTDTLDNDNHQETVEEIVKETDNAADNEADNNTVKGTLTMATTANFFPYEYLDGGNIVGIDVEIAQAIANKLGMELEINDIEFDSIITGVQTGEYDMGMAGITVTDERKQSVDFSDNYATNIQSVIVKQGSTIKTIDDMLDKNASYKIGVQFFSVGDIYLSTDLDDYDHERVIQYDTYSDAVSALSSGKVDAVVLDNAPAKSYVASNSGLKMLDADYISEEYAICFSKDNTELKEKVNGALQELIEDGTVKRIVDKYLTAD